MENLLKGKRTRLYMKCLFFFLSFHLFYVQDRSSKRTLRLSIAKAWEHSTELEKYRPLKLSERSDNFHFLMEKNIAYR